MGEPREARVDIAQAEAPIVGEANGFRRSVPIHGSCSSSRVGPDGLQVRQVEGDQVVAEQVVRAIDERVQLIPCGGQVATAEDQGLAAVGADRREGVDAMVSPADLKVDSDAP